MQTIPRRVYKFRRSIGIVKVIKESATDLIKEFKIQGKLTNDFLTKAGIHDWLYEDAQKQREAKKGEKIEVKKFNLPEKELERQTEKWLTVVKPSHDRMANKLLNAHKKAGNVGGQKALRDMGIGNISFNLQNKKMVSRFKSRGVKITGIVAQNTLKRFRKILIKGYYELGEDPRVVKKIIEDLFEKTYKNRAWTIAKTETAIAQSETQHETYVENNVKMRSWLAIDDGKTRSSHLTFMQRQSPRRIDVPFKNPVTGGTIMYPHDPSGPAEEVINCRCDEVVESFYKGQKPTKDEVWSGK